MHVDVGSAALGSWAAAFCSELDQPGVIPTAVLLVGSSIPSALGAGDRDADQARLVIDRLGPNALGEVSGGTATAGRERLRHQRLVVVQDRLRRLCRNLLEQSWKSQSPGDLRQFLGQFPGPGGLDVDECVGAVDRSLAAD